MERRRFIHSVVGGCLLAATAGSTTTLAANPYQNVNRVRNPNDLSPMESFHVARYEWPAARQSGNVRALRVTIGPPHVMEPEHFIQWLEIYVGPAVAVRMDFSPAMSVPAIELPLVVEGRPTVRLLYMCNKHGLWESAVAL